MNKIMKWPKISWINKFVRLLNNSQIKGLRDKKNKEGMNTCTIELQKESINLEMH